jgi:Domain of unknown function (DUF4440)
VLLCLPDALVRLDQESQLSVCRWTGQISHRALARKGCLIGAKCCGNTIRDRALRRGLSNVVEVLIYIGREPRCADDFAGVDIDGSLYSKADSLNGFRTEPSEFVSIHLNALQIRLYGNAAVAQGNESWEKKDGTPGKFVWTDTWIRRDGRWQIVAAEDVVADEDPVSPVAPDCCNAGNK